VFSVDQSIAIYDADDIWPVQLPLEFEIAPAFVHTVINRAENLPLKNEKLVLFPYF
jgi:hypothetical protein